MKRILLLLAVMVITTPLLSQALHLVYLEKALLSQTVTEAEQVCRSLGYETYDGTTNNSDNDCLEEYTFRREVKGIVPFFEDIILMRKCNSQTGFLMVRLRTRDVKLFFQLKQECMEQTGTVLQREGTKDGFIFQEYKNQTTVYSFKNGSDTNGKAYFIDLFLLN